MQGGVKLGVVMDPIDSIKVDKDSTFAMLLEAQARGWELWYMEPSDLALCDGQVQGRVRRLRVEDSPDRWFELDRPRRAGLDELDVLLMRKDPPVDMQYIYTTYLLDLVEKSGVVVVNRPQGLRDVNEKVFVTHFPRCTPPTLVTSSISQIRDFLHEQERIVVKPLDGMGGASVFRLAGGDPNTNVVLETLTLNGRRSVMAQRFIDAIDTSGDKRILLIDGVAVPHALARIPAPGESRGNLAAGARGVGAEVSERELWICHQVGPVLREKGLIFAGLDLIGDYLTEINVTSPTCIRELDRTYSTNISARLLDCVEARLIAR